MPVRATLSSGMFDHVKKWVESSWTSPSLIVTPTIENESEKGFRSKTRMLFKNALSKKFNSDTAGGDEAMHYHRDDSNDQLDIVVLDSDWSEYKRELANSIHSEVGFSSRLSALGASVSSLHKMHPSAFSRYSSHFFMSFQDPNKEL